MTVYTPFPTVTLAGVQYVNNTISNIRINAGRNDVIEQPQPGFANIELITDANTPLAIALSQPVSIAINKSVTGTQEIFNGLISDVQITLDAYSAVGSIAKYSITAVGPLSSLDRYLVGAAGYAMEKDGTRVLNILTDAFLQSWSDVSPTLTWQQVPNTTTWATYDGVNTALVNALTANVDVPGTYDLAAYTLGKTNALQLAQFAAQSGRGVLRESGTGQLFYDDFGSRALTSPLTLTGADIAADGLMTNAQWGEIVNDADVTFATGVQSARDEQSVIAYGQLTGSRSTQLQNSADALTQATAFVQSRAYPRMYPEQISIPLHSPTISDATRDALAAVFTGQRIATSALPAVFGTTFDGFVEGYSWNLTRYTADLALTCSAYSETYYSIVWLQLSSTDTWATFNPFTTWNTV